MTFKTYQNVHQIVKETVDNYTDQPAFRWTNQSGDYESVTWGHFYDQVKQVTKSLISLGVQKGEKVDILSYTCYKWVLSDVGTTTAGAITVGIYQSLLPKDCEYIINHSDAVVLFIEDETQLKKILSIRDKLTKVKKVVMFTGDLEGDDWVISFDEFLTLGKDIPDKEVEDRATNITPQDEAAIVYTSGTTGVPKGVVLTHDNLLFTAQSALDCADTKPTDQMFLFLPLAHVFARMIVYGALNQGLSTTFATSMDTIVDEIKKSQPDWFPSVPRIFEKVYSKVVSGAEAAGGLKLKIFNWACAVGNEVSDCKLNKKPIPFFTNIKYGLATKLVFTKLHAALGGNLRWAVSGAAPLNADIAKFFHAAGILVLEGIGMTENTSFTNVNRIDNYRFGWVGQPGPGIEQKIAEDGEVMFRGRNVMKEYYKMPAETAETIDEDGWLHTGDLGEIDDEGFLRISGRKKDLIITAGGKNIAPSPIEGTIATSKYINQVCVIGDRRKFLSALITLDQDNITEYAQENNITFSNFEELIKNEKINALIQQAVDEKNKNFASYETIKKFTIVEEFTIENDLITPTLKVKKNVVQKVYQEAIDAMY
ncbi:AMP-dependent synthetase/ligase [candidate division CSSED10-310 bacterium]|uniref:AMP-dependent synthetase/ligase n=1 Tax=candidate division CSSED10-310 bacterium TaxID=2855610 RepID=A0ABV6Z189_UNCC1